jgi:NitT/TauT family transport system permease protein
MVLEVVAGQGVQRPERLVEQQNLRPADSSRGQVRIRSDSAAFPQILAGLKISWAFAWPPLIAAELATVIIIGLLVEGLLFRTIERHSVRKWGMQR